MEVALFEDDAWSNFLPLSATRHVSQQLLGTRTLLAHVSKVLGAHGLSLLGRDYLAGVVGLQTGLRYNEADGPLLLLNARANPLGDIEAWMGLAPGAVVLDREEVVAASVSRADLSRITASDGTLSRARLTTLVSGYERIVAASPALFTYPWEILEANGDAISRATQGVRKRLIVSPSAEVEDHVSFDTRDGPVIVDDKARIEAFSRVSGPCYIASEVTIHSALIRGGTTIGLGCKVGGEVASSIMYRRSNKAHLGYLGHSIVGEWVNIGAGAVTSDLKNTYGTVRVVRGASRIDTGLVKLGAMIGDMAKVSIGSMIYGGKTLGVAARCAGTVDTDVPDFYSYEGQGRDTVKLELEPVLVAQRRMKARRGEELTAQETEMIEYVYAQGTGRARRSDTRRKTSGMLKRRKSPLRGHKERPRQDDG